MERIRFIQITSQLVISISFHHVIGGSYFREFAKERFGFSQSVASIWVSIGRGEVELIDNINKFSPDYRAMYQYLRLSEDQKSIRHVEGDTRELPQVWREICRASDSVKFIVDSEFACAVAITPRMQICILVFQLKWARRV